MSHFSNSSYPIKSIEAALSAVSPGVREALERCHEALNFVGVPHALIGGLAVGAHGYAHATKDVDFLIPDVVDEEFTSPFEGTTFITARIGVPLRCRGVKIDYLPPRGPAKVRQRLRGLFFLSEAKSDIVVAPEDVLTYLKLNAGRLKDYTAIVELIKVGLDVKQVRGFLADAGVGAGLFAEEVQRVRDRFERCVREADAETENENEGEI